MNPNLITLEELEQYHNCLYRIFYRTDYPYDNARHRLRFLDLDTWPPLESNLPGGDEITTWFINHPSADECIYVFTKPEIDLMIKRLNRLAEKL